MDSPLNLRASVLALIASAHLGLLWLVLSGLTQSKVSAPVPLPVMVEMLPSEQPVKPEPPRPAPPEAKPQPKKLPPTPQPKKETPKTTESDKALTAPKPKAEPAPQAPTTAPEPAPLAPSAAPTPTALAPLIPPRFNAAYLKNPAPVYPVMLRRAGEEGKVVLRVFVTADGTAGDIQVLHPASFPEFNEAAVAAVRKWRFVPARRGETPVAEWVQVPIEFKLN